MKKTKEDYSNVHICSVKLTDGGLKGVVVEYEKVENVNDREYRNKFTTTMKYATHIELNKCFKWLEKHLLSICGYDKDDEALLSRLNITGVKADGRGFMITAKMEVYDNGKVVSLVTPFTTGEDEYLFFEDVQKIIEGIYEETKVYLSKSVVIQDQQLVIQYYDKYKGAAEKEGFDKDTFLKLPEQEQIEFATQLLKKKKMIVIHEEELEIPDTTGLNELDDVDVKQMIQLEEKVVEEEPEEVMEVEEDDDDFSLGVEVKEPAVSTAKRKSA